MLKREYVSFVVLLLCAWLVAGCSGVATPQVT
jgi:predicted small secreted protein